MLNNLKPIKLFLPLNQIYHWDTIYEQKMPPVFKNLAIFTVICMLVDD